ncbi:NAD-dependent succinate-semialdehyde dehydrogenase [Cellulosimicrobium arenosum]|uniref:NAD-dependent succinate-semialdehyde dehydrogenase n=1 Tax=Cellulosimicrobium arenosum TaxID=2708133 RepID=A0A927J0Z5_9MICO|nr:NAD-dependent succinate-semialdehyde dehydrogenase [Cellulosimicrobium arenosum]
MTTEVLTGVSSQLWIGGDWVPAQDGDEMEVRDPGRDEAIDTVASAGPQDAHRALDAADSVAAAWAGTPARVRSEILLRAYDAMIADRERLARIIVIESGKTLADARAEVQYAADFFAVYGRAAYDVEGRLSRSADGTRRILVSHAPVGVAVLVTPWNFPAAMVTRKLAPALAAGCTAILKPSSATPFMAAELARIMADAGLPGGVFNVLPSAGSQRLVGALLDDARVQKLSFTGSTEVGRKLLAQTAQRIVNTSLELGGNAPFLVMENSDVDAAIDGAFVAKMRNTGQSCIAANRYYVHESLAEAFTAGLAARMGRLTVGHGLDESVGAGPVISGAARDALAQHVDAAVSRGARVLCGGSSLERAGWYYAPTVLGNVAADDPVLAHELFGPVAPVVTVSSDDEAVERANDTQFGLAAYVYTGSLEQSLQVAERLQAGVIGVNRGLVSDASAPFGGVKQSGLGREGAAEGLLEYMEPKYISAAW